MIGRADDRSFECVLVDLNTQNDFCSAQGARPVCNVQSLVPALRSMVTWAKENEVPVISSLESLRSDDRLENGRRCLCVDGSPGQRKVEFTLFAQCALVEVDNTLSCPLDVFQNFQQVIFRKRTDDLLSNPKADRLFNVLPTDEFVLFGNAIETSVKALALGLVARQKRVLVALDACGYWNQSTADLAARQMIAKGVEMIGVADLLSRKLVRRFSPWVGSPLRSSAELNGRRNGLRRRSQTG